MPNMRLEFYGAAGGVIGSHTVLDNRGLRIGVDAGLFQGDERNQSESGFGYSGKD